MRQKMGVLGPVGTHSEVAARYLMEWQSLDCEIVCFGDIDECLHAAEMAVVDAAFVPVENSLEGAIAVTLDALARSDTLRVRREVIWPVHNYLMARAKDAEIRVVYSHAQPIAQCRDFLLRHCPQAELIKTASTARAAEIVGASLADAGAAARTARASLRLCATGRSRRLQRNPTRCCSSARLTVRGRGPSTMCSANLRIAR